MKILAIERDVAGIRDEQFTEEILVDEARRAWELCRAGILRELHFSEDRHAVLTLEAADAAEARRQLGTLPLVRAGLIEFEVLALTPYDGFARLFKK